MKAQSPSLTRAQRAALAAIGANNGNARISNSTSVDRGLVYWRCWDALKRAGLATSDRAGYLSLTEAGWKEAEVRQLELALVAP